MSRAMALQAVPPVCSDLQTTDVKHVPTAADACILLRTDRFPTPRTRAVRRAGHSRMAGRSRLERGAREVANGRRGRQRRVRDLSDSTIATGAGTATRGGELRPKATRSAGRLRARPGIRSFAHTNTRSTTAPKQTRTTPPHPTTSTNHKNTTRQRDSTAKQRHGRRDTTAKRPSGSDAAHPTARDDSSSQKNDRPQRAARQQGHTTARQEEPREPFW